MSSGFSDKLKSTGNKIKGEVKETVGEKTNDPKLQAEGKLDQLKGEAQEKIADVKEAISDKFNNGSK
ncbi:CsbD family protein [Lysinibacillus sp. 2017]|uniref:CsbD family protein n=1 Tax=unclassified Lysinibacillus TaxID=2636778 RepID=UPI000D5281CC|nr:MULTISPECIES: CsbD family protein [unclassified Lysinibacillus]AWE08081.1 CsbD family protein [Lysinibacillus sp. 2017]TGN36415.1 CsbD family protein [Lysinibacillus sp. S2017]